jgi:hypothetical protein
MRLSPLESQDDYDSPWFARRITCRFDHGSTSGFQAVPLCQSKTRLDASSTRSVPSTDHQPANYAWD